MALYNMGDLRTEELNCHRNKCFFLNFFVGSSC